MKEYYVISNFPKFKFGFKGKEIALDKGSAKVEIDDKDCKEFELLFINNPDITPFAKLAGSKQKAKEFSEVVEKQNPNNGTVAGTVSSNNLLVPKDPILDALAAAGADFKASQANQANQQNAQQPNQPATQTANPANPANSANLTIKVAGN